MQQWLEKGKRAFGIDTFGPADYRRLPRAGRQRVVDCMNEIESEACWPWQVLLVLMALLPKPDGGMRTIALLAGLVRMWAKVRKAEVGIWVETAAGA